MSEDATMVAQFEGAVVLLGQMTSEEIAKLFVEMGIRGQRTEIAQCPVARYLRSLGFLTAWAGPYQCGRFSRGRSIDTPASVSEFMRRFDIGRYPVLEAQL